MVRLCPPKIPISNLPSKEMRFGEGALGGGQLAHESAALMHELSVLIKEDPPPAPCPSRHGGHRSQAATLISAFLFPELREINFCWL